MTWAEQIAEPQIRPFFYVVFGGIPYYFGHSDPVGEAWGSNWTAPTSGGVALSWKRMLDISGLSHSGPALNRRAGVSTPGSMNLKLIEDENAFLATLFAPALATAKTAILAEAVTVSETQIDVTSDDNFGSGIWLYCGNETMRATAEVGNPTTQFTVTRGAILSDANSYELKTYDDIVIGPEISSVPVTWLGRKVHVYMNFLDEDGLPIDSAPGGAHEQIIFKGFISGLQCKRSGNEWIVEADDVLKILERKICSGVSSRPLKTDRTLVGWDYSDTVIFSVDTWYVTTDGTTMGFGDYVKDHEGDIGVVDRQRSLISITDVFGVGGATPAIVKKADVYGAYIQKLNARILSGYQCIEVQDFNPASDAPIVDPISGATIDKGKVGHSLVTSWPGGVMSSWVTVNGSYWPCAIAGFPAEHSFSSEKSGDISVPGPVTVTSFMSEKKAHLIHSEKDKAVILGDSAEIAPFVTMTTSDGGYDQFVLIGENKIVKIDEQPNATNELDGLSYNRIVDTRREWDSYQDVEQGSESSVMARQVAAFDGQTTGFYTAALYLMNSFDGDGTGGTYDKLHGGIGARIPSGYFDAAEWHLHDVNTPVVKDRWFMFSSPDSLSQIFGEEAKLTGTFIGYDLDFKLLPITVDTNKSVLSTSLFKIDESNIISSEIDIKSNYDSIINQVIVKTKYSRGKDQFEDQIIFNDVQSQQRYQDTRTLVIANKSIRIPLDVDPKKYFLEHYGAFLNQFQDGYPVITVKLNHTAFGLELGQQVLFTHPTLPNFRSGARGMSGERMYVAGFNKNYDEMTVDVSLTADDFKQKNTVLLCPSLRVNGNQSGVNTINVSQTYYSHAGNDTDHFEVGWKVGLYDVSASEWGIFNNRSITAKTATSITIDGAAVNVSDGDVIEFDKSYPTVDGDQQLYAWFADDVTELIDGSDPAKVFA